MDSGQLGLGSQQLRLELSVDLLLVSLLGRNLNVPVLHHNTTVVVVVVVVGITGLAAVAVIDDDYLGFTWHY